MTAPASPATIPTMFPQTVEVHSAGGPILLAIVGPHGGQSERGTVYLSTWQARDLAAALVAAATFREAHTAPPPAVDLDALDLDHDPRPYDELLRAGLCLVCRRPVRPTDFGPGWTHNR